MNNVVTVAYGHDGEIVPVELARFRFEADAEAFAKTASKARGGVPVTVSFSDGSKATFSAI